jgi:hypothetical protein
VATPRDEHHNDQQEGQDGHNDCGHFHPAGHARGRLAVGGQAGVLAGVAIAGRVSHLRLLVSRLVV